MSWWSTVIGGAVGFMIGGPLGAMLGVAFAGNFSKRKSSSGFSNNFGPGNQQRVQAAFLVGYFLSWDTSQKLMERCRNQRLFSLNR